MFGLLGDVLSGIGRGINSGLDRMANGNLTAVLPNFDPSQLTPQQQRALRGQFLMNLGQGIQAMSPAAGVQQFQQTVAPAMLAAQQRALQQKMFGQINDVMSSGLPQVDKLTSIGNVLTRYGRAEDAARFFKAAHDATPGPDKVHSIGYAVDPATGKVRQQIIRESGAASFTDAAQAPNYQQIHKGNETAVVDMNNPGQPPAASFPVANRQQVQMGDKVGIVDVNDPNALPIKEFPITQRPIPGRDVPFPPEVEQQKTRIAQAGRASIGYGGGAGGGQSAEEIAQAVMTGDQPPDLKGLYRMAGPVRAALAHHGFNLSRAQVEWSATSRYLNTLNGPQQTRLQQAVTTLSSTLPLIRQRYKEWQATGLPNGFQQWNKAALRAAVQLPGRQGAAARALDQLVNDAIPELANVYMGGNAPSDKALGVAQHNLAGEWNAEQFFSALGNVEETLKYRSNAINFGSPAGLNGGNRYFGNSGQTPQGGGNIPAPMRVKVWNPRTGKFEER